MFLSEANFWDALINAAKKKVWKMQRAKIIFSLLSESGKQESMDM